MAVGGSAKLVLPSLQRQVSRLAPRVTIQIAAQLAQKWRSGWGRHKSIDWFCTELPSNSEFLQRGLSRHLNSYCTGLARVSVTFSAQDHRRS